MLAFFDVLGAVEKEAESKVSIHLCDGNWDKEGLWPWSVLPLPARLPGSFGGAALSAGGAAGQDPTAGEGSGIIEYRSRFVIVEGSGFITILYTIEEEKVLLE